MSQGTQYIYDIISPAPESQKGQASKTQNPICFPCLKQFLYWDVIYVCMCVH